MNGGSQGRSGIGRYAVALCAAAMAAALPSQAGAQTTYTAPDPKGDEHTFVSAPPPGKLFGLNEAIIDYANGQGPDAYAGYVHNVGGNAIRTILDWAWAEPLEQDEWAPRRWQVWTDAYNAALAKGLTPIFVLTSAPFWARENPEGTSWCAICPYPPAQNAEMLGEWAEFVTEVATRFPESIIQSWNEPNLHYWWGFAPPDPERYAELADVAYDAVRAVELKLEAQGGGNVEIPVIAPGLANVSEETADTPAERMSLREFLDRAYAAPDHPLAENIDGIAANLFPHSVDFGANTLLAAAFEDIRASQATAGDDSKIYITETGLPGSYAGSGLPEHVRAEASYRLYNRLTSMEDVAAVLFHRIIEPEENDFQNPFEYGLAWMRYSPPPAPQTQAAQPEPKPVYCLFTALARRTYRPCLTARITGGPKRRVRRRIARFTFDLAPGSQYAGFTALQCSLDSAPYASCETSYTTPRLKRGRHVFRIRAVNATGQTGVPAQRSWVIKKKKKKRRRR